jgi:hypothetical protein
LISCKGFTNVGKLPRPYRIGVYEFIKLAPLGLGVLLLRNKNKLSVALILNPSLHHVLIGYPRSKEYRRMLKERHTPFDILKFFFDIIYTAKLICILE